MALGRPTPDQKILQTDEMTGTQFAPITNPTSVEHKPYYGYPSPNVDASMNSFGIPVYYGSLNPSIAKSYAIHPTNQGQRGGIAARQVMMIDPRDNPSRSQFSEGYTMPLQQYGAQLTWATPSGQHTAGKPASQPSTKLASPFGTAVPIRTRMPWDL